MNNIQIARTSSSIDAARQKLLSHNKGGIIITKYLFYVRQLLEFGLLCSKKYVIKAIWASGYDLEILRAI